MRPSADSLDAFGSGQHIVRCRALGAQAKVIAHFGDLQNEIYLDGLRGITPKLLTAMAISQPHARRPAPASLHLLRISYESNIGKPPMPLL